VVSRPIGIWTLPLVGNADSVISQAALEYIQAKRGAPYSLTEVLCHLRERVPALRTQIATAKREAARRAHVTQVEAICDPKVAA
jgi:hypothetical protein